MVPAKSVLPLPHNCHIMKPRANIAMANLIKEARERIPFNLPLTGFCEGRCDECPEKLLEFLDMELEDWDSRLKRGVVPDLGEVSALAKSCREVYSLLEKKGLVPAESGLEQDSSREENL